MVEAVKRGFPQREIADAAFTYQREVETGVRKIVGVNAYTEGDDAHIPILRIDPNFETDQVRRLQQLRRDRDPEPVAAALTAIATAARDPHENLMPHLLDAARADATEGEMVLSLQEVFGNVCRDPGVLTAAVRGRPPDRPGRFGRLSASAVVEALRAHGENQNREVATCASWPAYWLPRQCSRCPPYRRWVRRRQKKQAS